MVVEASQLLGSFDKRLRQYAARKLIKAGVHLRRGMVKEAYAQHLVLQVVCFTNIGCITEKCRA